LPCGAAIGGVSRGGLLRMRIFLDAIKDPLILRV